MQLKSNSTIASAPLLILTVFCGVSLAIILISLFWMRPVFHLFLQLLGLNLSCVLH